MNDSKKKILKNIDDNCSIYNILCIKTHIYYNRLSCSIHIPLVSISSIMTIVNSSVKDETILNILNIVFNLFTAILLVINSNLKFDSKSDDFKNYQIRFVKLQYECNKLLDIIEDNKEGEINELSEKVYNLKKNYDDITMSMLDIPSHICIKVYNNYKDETEYVKLPPILLSYKEKHNFTKL